MRGALVDAGPLVAAFDAADPHHAETVAAMSAARTPLVSVWPAVGEAHYFLRKRTRGGAEKLLEAIAAGALELAPLTAEDIPRIQDIQREHAERDLDLADAALAAVSERDGFDTLMTLDERDFRAIARARKGRLKLLVPGRGRP